MLPTLVAAAASPREHPSEILIPVSRHGTCRQLREDICPIAVGVNLNRTDLLVILPKPRVPHIDVLHLGGLPGVLSEVNCGL